MSLSSSRLSPRKVGIDLDGVLAGFDPAFFRAAWGRRLLTGWTWNEQVNHDIPTSFPGQITDEQVMEILLMPGFYRKMTPVRPLVEMARGFSERGWEIHIVTARPYTSDVVDDTMRWLRETRIPFYCTSFIPSNEKHPYAEKHHLNLFIEDRLETANAVAPICTSFLVESPQNIPSLCGNPSLDPRVLRRPAGFFGRLWAAASPQYTPPVCS